MNTQALVSKSCDSDIYSTWVSNCARIVATTVVLAASATAGAEERWTWNVEPYLWATDVNMDLSISDRTIVDETIPFEDLLDDLERVIQIRAEGRYGKHGLFADLFDVELADSGDRVTLPGGTGTELVLDTEIGLTILDVAGLYNPKANGTGVTLHYGIRAINLRNDIRAESQRDGMTLANVRVDSNDTLFDAMVGVNYTKQLGKGWAYQLSATASTGDTDLTWSINPTIVYSFGEEQLHQLLFGYERFVIDFDTESFIDMDMTMTGPTIVGQFQF